MPELRSIYEAEIRPDFVEGRPSSINPRFVVICAQPGAGKSRLSGSLREAFAQAAGAAVHVDVDALRSYHSKFNEIMQHDPMKMDDHTGYEAWVWKGFLLNDAHDAPNNIVMEVTLRTAEQTREQIKFFKKEGFATDLHVLAVHDSTSRLGIFQRFESEIAAGRPPRRVDLAFHEEAATALPKNVGLLEIECELDISAVHTRDGRILYTRKGQAGVPRAEQAILIERERAWTVDESLRHITDWRNVMLRAQARPDGPLKAAFYMQELQQAVTMGITHPQLSLPIPASEQDQMPAVVPALKK